MLAIPTLNEAGSIGALLRSVPRDLVTTIIVADGGSTDSTRVLAEREGALVLEAGSGYGRACLKAATASADDAVMVYMDGDGADDPASIGDMVAPILAGSHDFVVGSRVTGRRQKGSMGWHQIAAGRAVGTILRVLYGTPYTDMCAFRAIGRDTLMALDMRETTYGWNIEMQMKAARRGLRILEIPVANRCRTAGSSKVAGSLRGTLRAGWRIVATLLRVAIEPATGKAT